MEISMDPSLSPTKVLQTKIKWLYSSNLEEDSNTDFTKVGKWMIFLSKATVDLIWSQIKTAVKEGHLWHSKVSTTDPAKPTHAIMIYTKDYTNIKDVIDTLNYLEGSGIKPANKVIRYKTDEQTYAGIYSGGTQRPWIYSSDTIRAKHGFQETSKSDGRSSGSVSGSRISSHNAANKNGILNWCIRGEGSSNLSSRTPHQVNNGNPSSNTLAKGNFSEDHSEKP